MKGIICFWRCSIFYFPHDENSSGQANARYLYVESLRTFLNPVPDLRKGKSDFNTIFNQLCTIGVPIICFKALCLDPSPLKSSRRICSRSLVEEGGVDPILAACEVP